MVCPHGKETELSVHLRNESKKPAFVHTLISTVTFAVKMCDIEISTPT